MLLQNASSGVLGSWTLDGQSNTTITAPTSGSFPFYNQELLDASNLDPDSYHNLSIVVSEAGAFYLDYILLQATSAFVASSDSRVGASSTTGSPDTSQPAVTSTPYSKSGLSSGVIAAAVVIPVVVLASLVFGYIFWRKRCRPRSGDRQNIWGDNNGDSSVVQWRKLPRSTWGKSHFSHPQTLG